MDIGSLKATITADAREIKAEIRALKKDLRDVGKDAKNTSKDFGSLDSALTTLGSSAALYGMVRAIKATVDEANRMYMSMRGLIQVSKALNQDVDATTQAAEDLAKKGFMSVNEAAQAIKTSLAMGLGLEETINLINAMADAAAYNRQTHYSWGEAIVASVEGIKQQRSELTDAVGITKNLSKMYEDYAKSIGTTEGKLSDAQKVQAAYNGFLKESELFAGNAQDAMDGYAGSVAEYSIAIKEAKAEIGEAFLPVIQETLDEITPMVIEFAKFAEENQNLILGVTGATVAFTAMIGVVSFLTFVFNTLRTAIIGLQAALGPAGWLLLGLSVLVPTIGAFSAGMSEAKENSIELAETYDKQANQLDRLISRYETLSNKASLTDAENKELHSTLNQIKDIAPDLISDYDEMGNALDLNAEKAKAYTDELKEMSRVQLELAAQEAELNIGKKRSELSEVNQRIREEQEANNKAFEETRQILTKINEVKQREKEIQDQIDAGTEDDNRKLYNVQRELREWQGIKDNKEEILQTTRENLSELLKQKGELQDQVGIYESILDRVRSINNETKKNDSVWNNYKFNKMNQGQTTASTDDVSNVTGKTIEDYQREQYQASMRWIQYKKDLNQLSEEEEIASYERLLSRYKQYTDIRQELEVKIYQTKQGLAQETFELENQIIKETLQARKEAEQDLLNKANETLYEYKKLIEERKKAELEAIEDKRDEIRKTYDEEKRYIDETTDRAINGIRQQITELDRSLREAEYLDSRKDRNEEISDLEAELQKYLLATSKEGIEKRKELERRIEELNNQQQREDRRREVEQQKEELNDEITRLQEQADKKKQILEREYENSLEALNKEKILVEEHYTEVLGLFEGHMNDMESIEETIKKARIAIQNETNEEILKNLRNFVDDYQKIYSDLMTNDGTGENSADFWNEKILDAKDQWWDAYLTGDKKGMEKASQLADEYRANGGTIESGELTSVDIARYKKLGWDIPDEYHTGGIAGVMNFSNPKELMPDEIRAILEYGETTFTQGQLSTLLKKASGSENESVVFQFGDVYLSGDQEEYERFWKTGADIMERRNRSKGVRKK